MEAIFSNWKQLRTIPLTVGIQVLWVLYPKVIIKQRLTVNPESSQIQNAGEECQGGWGCSAVPSLERAEISLPSVFGPVPLPSKTIHHKRETGRKHRVGLHTRISDIIHLRVPCVFWVWGSLLKFLFQLTDRHLEWMLSNPRQAAHKAPDVLVQRRSLHYACIQRGILGL